MAMASKCCNVYPHVFLLVLTFYIVMFLYTLFFWLLVTRFKVFILNSLEFAGAIMSWATWLIHGTITCVGLGIRWHSKVVLINGYDPISGSTCLSCVKGFLNEPQSLIEVQGPPWWFCYSDFFHLIQFAGRSLWCIWLWIGLVSSIKEPKWKSLSPKIHCWGWVWLFSHFVALMIISAEKIKYKTNSAKSKYKTSTAPSFF